MQNDNNKLATMRHSLSHIMMQALERLYGAVPGVGPAIENGFYHDFDCDYQVTETDLPKIEKEMKKIIKENLPIKKKVMPMAEGIKFLKKKGYRYTAELAQDLKKEGEKKISFYEQGDFINMCKGPHVKSTGEINPDAFKLTKVAGAYWKGDEKNKMIQRIYGVAFNTKKELNDYLKMMEEAEKRDHRKLGKELELFMIDDEVGQGLILWLPKGAILRHLVMDFAFNTYLKKGYEPVSTPHIASLKLWQHSGHLDFYKESLYSSFGIEDEEYMLKPMNCPLQVQMYKSKKRSYRDLPIRWTEMGTVYRYEKSGTLHGLTRVRGFTQDDAHIICTPNQLHNELREALELSLYMFKIFNFKDFEMNVSIRDPKNKKKFIGNDAMWEKAESELKSVLKEIGFKDFVYDVGGAVFYGPKIDIKVNDALGRPWQLSTIQFDFNLPSRFDMRYQGPDGKDHIPFMIHRALLGSLERFLGVLIEHYAGAFPVWLSPVQVKIISVGAAHKKYCHKLAKEFKEHDIRIEVDDANETVGNKIRKATQEKVPYILVIGDREIKSDKLAIRDRGSNKVRQLSKKKFIEEIEEKMRKRK